MARKKLLSEGEIRQFMKLASLRPVGQGRLSEMGGGYMAGARDDEGDMPPVGGEMPEPEGELPEEMPSPEDDMPEEAPPEGDLPEVSEEEARVLVALGKRMEDALPEEPMDEPDPMGEPEPDLGPPEGEVEALPGGVDDEMMQEVVRRLAAKMKATESQPRRPRRRDVDESQIVSEVAERVRNRLKAEDRKERLADQLSERIMDRLTK